MMTLWISAQLFAALLRQRWPFAHSTSPINIGDSAQWQHNQTFTTIGIQANVLRIDLSVQWLDNQWHHIQTQLAQEEIDIGQ